MSKILSVIAPEGFQEVEYANSKGALEECGHEVVTVSSVRNAVDRQGNMRSVDLLLDEVNPDDYDAILFVGGPGSRGYFDDATCHKLARAFYESGKLTSAICAAPVILAKAGLLKGKRVTCFPHEISDLIASGAEHTGAHVEKDGLIITADGPNSAHDFGVAISGALETHY